jgi:hypothetical protein
VSDRKVTAVVRSGPGDDHAPATAEEVAAVVTAISVLTAGGADVPGVTTPRWRFSGRWWTTPVPQRRDRP